MTTNPTQLTPCPGVFDDGNVFFVLGKARRCLKRAGRREEAEEMTAAATSGGSYDVAIGTVMRYVDDVEADALCEVCGDSGVVVDAGPQEGCWVTEVYCTCAEGQRAQEVES